MKKIICLVLLLSTLLACGGERKPLKILPVMAEDLRMVNDTMYERKDYPIPNCFYFKNFRDDKQCLKELMQYVKDTISTKIVQRKMTNYAFFCQKNKGYFEGDVGYVDQKGYNLFYTDSLAIHFKWFTTPSDFTFGRDASKFPQRCDYKYHIVRKGKSAVVYFDYKEFNTDVWQKFINVVFYDRDSIGTADRKKYNLWIPGQARHWRNWSAPTQYCLLNQRTKEIECVIKYPLADNYNAFTMEIH